MYLTSLGEAFIALSSMGFTCTSLFPQSSAVERGGARCLVLRFVSTCDAQVPFAPRGPGARANVCDSDASTPAHLKSARHMARVGEARCVLRPQAAARAGCNGCALGGHGSEGRQQQRVDMGMEAVCLFCYRSVNCCYDTYVIGPPPVGKS